MNNKPKSIFRYKNGRRFQIALTKAAEGDTNVGIMFLDNNINVDLKIPIKNGEFREVLRSAFSWDNSNEGYDFWLDVWRNLKDYKITEKG